MNSIFAPPPGALIATPMKLPVMESADRDRKAITDLASHGPLLRKLDVVGIRGGATADETWLGGHKSQMVAIALPRRLADHRHRLGARFAA